MAIRYAVANGVWSATSTWNGGTLPTSADDVYSNTFTVTIDTSPTVLSINNAATTGVTAGGRFILENGVTLTCTAANGINKGIDNNYTLTFSLPFPAVAYVNANSTIGTAQRGCGVGNFNTGTLYYTGDIYSGSASTGVGLLNNSSGTVYIVGNLYSTSQYNDPTGTVVNASSGTIYINGQVNGGKAVIVANISNGNVFITGDVIGSNSLNAINNSGTGTVTVTGSMTGGISAGAFTSGSAGTLVHTGNVIAANNVPAIRSSNTGATVILSGPFITSSNGTNPVYSPRWFWLNSPAPTYYQIRTANLETIRPLYTADSVGGNPSVSNVRSGTIFGPSNELTGTVMIPSIYSVLTGVPVDNMVGSGPIDPTQFWNYPISGITTSGSIGERLKTAATVNVMGQLISDSFSAK